MASESNKVGSAYYELEARITPLLEAMTQARKAVVDAAEQNDASAEDIALKWEVTSARIVREVESLTDALKRPADEAGAKLERARDLVDGIGDAAERSKRKADELNRTINEVRTEADMANAGIGDGFEASGQRAVGSLGETSVQAGVLSQTLGKVTGAARGLRTALGLISLGTAVGAGITLLYEQLARARKESEALKKAAKEAADSVEELFATESRNRQQSALGGEYESLRIARERVVELQGELDRLGERSESVAGKFVRFMTGSQISGQMFAVSDEIERIQNAIFENEQKRINRTKALREQEEKDAIRSAKLIAETIRSPASDDPTDAFAATLQADIDRMKQIRDGLEGESRNTLTRLISDAEASADKQVRDFFSSLRQDAAQQLQEEARAIELETLSPLEQKAENIRQRIGELQEQVDSGALRGFDNLQASAEQLIHVLNDQLGRLNEQQKEANKELPDVLAKAVEDGTRRALEQTGLLTASATLAALRANTELIYTEATRIAQ